MVSEANVSPTVTTRNIYSEVGMMDILLKDEEIRKHINVWFLRGMDAIRTGAERPDQLEIAGNIAKAQLKKVVEYIEELGMNRRTTARHTVNYITISKNKWEAIKKEAGI